MSVNKKKLVLNTVPVSLGCKKLKLTSFFNPKPKPKPHSPSSKTTTHSSLSEFETPTSFSPSSDTTTQYWDMDMGTDKETKGSTITVRGFGRVGGESLAVEKESDDPYLDFKYSMLQMILEKEIYSKVDLKELLNCFLKLNSPYYHGIIVRAFTEIWNGLFSIKPRADSPMPYFGGFH
ncbi:Transcription repressor OFP8 [Hibiscus syriacus]|uniref:Transcription repressor n=1 Tax=Hibiscus syriacus TaxID=106335 RepID=A0A6A2XV45_HIBSY|nr:transcription repressor OFP6-like [Hibiscus syriacus]KAE8679408.1 Transcription repressor OFP8 [Hibiscus syriacus]